MNVTTKEIAEQMKSLGLLTGGKDGANQAQVELSQVRGCLVFLLDRAIHRQDQEEMTIAGKGIRDITRIIGDGFKVPEQPISCACGHDHHHG